MSLYTRVLKLEPDRPKIPTHGLQSVIAEFTRDKITQAQAETILQHLGGGVALDAGELADVVAIRNLVTDIAITGSAAAQADARARRALKALEIDQVWLLVDANAPGYTTEVEIKAKLGVV